MQLVVLHYHLNRGGVTSVIENHLRSLALLDSESAPTKVAIVYGGRAAMWNQELAQALPFECTLIVAPELEYDHLQASEGQLLEALKSILVDFDRDSTVLHVHNHSLGKNVAMTSAISCLANEGWRLLLQIHDFAEDLRPANYQHLLSNFDSSQQLHEQLYPQTKQIHYAVLNQRDYQVLAASGVTKEQLHLLPNPVKPPKHSFDKQQSAAIKQELAETLGIPVEHKIILYPVRAIRRKNLGELLLWSMLAENKTFIVTLAPLNPQEVESYLQWVEFAKELQLPAQFDTASRCDLPFESVYAAADAIITTSVAEGFGMAYLEASLAGKSLVGRILPGICSDFLNAGMQFPGLTEEMSIPSDQLDLNALRDSHSRLLNELRSAYRLSPIDTKDYQASDFGLTGDTIDFGRLGCSEQQSFLLKVKDDEKLRIILRKLNPQVQMNDAEQDLSGTLDHNRRMIAENYSTEVIGKKLFETYDAVMSSSMELVEHRPSIAASVLNSFVHPSMLFPLRLES
jgi:glycosyltransferase involved in cell wall biosynthesis